MLSTKDKIHIQQTHCINKFHKEKTYKNKIKQTTKTKYSTKTKQKNITYYCNNLSLASIANPFSLYR